MQLTSDVGPIHTTIRQVPFQPAIGSEPTSLYGAVRDTLIRWAGSPTGEIHPSRVRAREEQTIFSSEPINQHKRGPHYWPTVRYGLHNWSVDPSTLFAAAAREVVPGQRATPDTITGAQLTQLFRRFDVNIDGVLQQGTELDALRADVGEAWTFTHNTVEDH